MDLTYRDLSKMIDHSLLHPTMTDAQVREDLRPAFPPLRCRHRVREAVFHPACPGNPCRIGCESLRRDRLSPRQQHHRDQGHRSRSACLAGAPEIDMVVNNGKVLGGDWDVAREIRLINEAVVAVGGILKRLSKTII